MDAGLGDGTSRFLQDVLREPQELRSILKRLLSGSRATLEEAARRFAAAPVRLLAGMGSSFHAGFAIVDFCDRAGLAVRNVDAGELVHFMKLTSGSVVLALSRSGRSVEVVELLPKARAAGATVVAITNDPESPLARAADLRLLLGAPFDCNVSVTMYSGVALAGALVAALATGATAETAATFSSGDERALDAMLIAAEKLLPRWRAAVVASDWCTSEAPTLLLARGPGLAAAHEARQLWEEAAKHPATALSTGAFRHGPNEVIRPGARVVLWLAAEGATRALDLELAADLRRAGAKVALVGREAPAGAADLSFELPAGPAAWQFLVELMPVRLLAEQLARVRGVDCDTFRYCPFVVEREGGLGGGHATR